MAVSKNKSDKFGYVYSTNPDFNFAENDAEASTIAPAAQKLRIQLETKHRGGKAATIIFGFVGTTTDLETLGKQLKTYCGTGGSAKDGEIIVQGDQREKVLGWLLQKGYTQTKKAGG